MTATRTAEVIGARWPEIDLDAAVWTVPAERMKAHIEHRIPLSPQYYRAWFSQHLSRLDIGMHELPTRGL